MLPLASEWKVRLAELMKCGCNDALPKCKGFQNGFIQSFNQLHICCASIDMVHAAIGRNFVGNLRYSISGKRQVIVVNWQAITLIAAKHSITISPGEDIPEYVEKVLQSFEESDLEEAKIYENSWYHEVGEGHMVVTPMATATIERGLPVSPNSERKHTIEQKKESLGLNLRLHWLEEKKNQGFVQLKEACELQKKQKLADDTTA